MLADGATYSTVVMLAFLMYFFVHYNEVVAVYGGFNMELNKLSPKDQHNVFIHVILVEHVQVPVEF